MSPDLSYWLRLPVGSRLLVMNLWESKVLCAFLTVWGTGAPNPCVAPGSLRYGISIPWNMVLLYQDLKDLYCHQNVSWKKSPLTWIGGLHFCKKEHSQNSMCIKKGLEGNSCDWLLEEGWKGRIYSLLPYLNFS